MKTVIAAAVGVGLIGSLAYLYATQPITYTAPNEPVVVEKEVEVDNLKKRIEDAQTAAMANIEAKAQAEYDAVFETEMSKVKAAVLLEVEQEIEAERLEVESQIQTY